MDKRALFTEVDRAVGEALSTRTSLLDAIPEDEWTDAQLREDAADVSRTIENVCGKWGWSSEEYNRVFRRLRHNRHTPSTASY